MLVWFVCPPSWHHSSCLFIWYFFLFFNNLIRNKINHEVLCITDCNHWIELGHLHNWVMSIEGLSNRERSWNSCSLDEEIIIFLRLCNFLHLSDHLVFKGAAHTSSTHLNHVFCFFELNPFTLDKINIHIKLAHIIKDDSNLEVLRVFNNIFNESGLSRAKEARQDNYLEFSHCWN